MFDHDGSVPELRIRRLNGSPVEDEGQFVLYWMTAYRRPFYNFALQRAIEQAQALSKPLLILEELRCDYPYASDRLHRFILNGMADNADYFATRPVRYYPFVETATGQSAELLRTLTASACLIIADDYPGFFLPAMVRATARKTAVAVEAVDSNGLLPLAAADRAFPTAHAFRRFLQKNLAGHLFHFPQQEPLKNIELPCLDRLPKQISSDWRPCSKALLAATKEALAELPIDHSVPSTAEVGGCREAENYLQRFLDERLEYYLERSEPERAVSSELSPYLHFGHISSHQIFAQLATRQNWSIGNLGPESQGKRSGWWGMSEPAESFLDELVTWREVGFNAARLLPDYDRYESLPAWARLTLAQHRDDPRPTLYTLEQFEQAQTHDPLWNAAQTQLLKEGRIHNYLRMLWGKKIFEWSLDAQAALQTMLTLNDKYALDGRDPNAISGIFWCLGRYDRAWGPERPIYGKIRYMTSENTARKFTVKNYLRRYAPDTQPDSGVEQQQSLPF